MIRFALATSILIAAALMGPAWADPVQTQFSPPPPIVALPSSSAPSYPQIPGVAPPAPAPGGSGVVRYHVVPRSTARSGSGTRYVQTHHGRIIAVPSGGTFGDRVSRCGHAGAAGGLGPNQLGNFMGQCVN
jgi:hypothetical protein